MCNKIIFKYIEHLEMKWNAINQQCYFSGFWKLCYGKWLNTKPSKILFYSQHIHFLDIANYRNNWTF